MKGDLISVTTLLNKYEILEKIGEGGYGVIYKAKDILLDRIVAIKRIIDREYKEYFLKEGRLLARLRHKNIIEIYTVETEERDDPLEGKTREIYLITEYVGGGNLLNYIDKHYYDIVNSNDNEDKTALIDKPLNTVIDKGKLIWKYKTGYWVRSSPAISGDTLYIGSKDGCIYAIAISTGEQDTPPWPMFMHNSQHTGSAEYEGE